MRHLRRCLTEHWHFILVVTVLTLVTTWPTLNYVWRTDVFWLPTGGSSDVFIKLWDVWYGGKFLTGQADRFYTDLMFYPEGVSLTFNSFFIPHVIVVNALQAFLPLSNAYSLTYIIIVFFTAITAYVYTHWLFRDKWLALFGATVFSFSPHVLGHPNHPEISFVALFPPALYCFHRGVAEGRRRLIIVAGLLTGLTTLTSLYAYVCLVITLGLYVLAFAATRWRDARFWRQVSLLAASTALASLWRIYHLAKDSQLLHDAATWNQSLERGVDLISHFVHPANPFVGPWLDQLWQPAGSAASSFTSYLGIVPLLLICVGLFNKGTRRKTLPWLGLMAVFLLLRLGSVLVVNGVVYEDVLLPKYYLNQLLPFAFAPFNEADHFMMGALLPLAVMASGGILALQRRVAIARRPWFLLLLITLVAVEYYHPVRDRLIEEEQLAFIHWLADQPDQDLALINLPMGRSAAKVYNLFQLLSGYPHVEGAISRTPDSAFDYIRANAILGAWYDNRAILCDEDEKDEYLSAAEQLEDDGFTHVVLHQQIGPRANYWPLRESLSDIEPAYSDKWVSVYQIVDLRGSCSHDM